MQLKDNDVIKHKFIINIMLRQSNKLKTLANDWYQMFVEYYRDIMFLQFLTVVNMNFPRAWKCFVCCFPYENTISVLFLINSLLELMMKILKVAFV